MSDRYEIAGKIVAKNSPEVREILGRFLDNFRGIDVWPTEVDDVLEEIGDSLRIDINRSVECGYSRAEKLESILLELSSYANPCIVYTSYGGCDDYLYVGPPEHEAEFLSLHALDQIKIIVGENSLTAAGLISLVDMLTLRLKQIPTS